MGESHENLLKVVRHCQESLDKYTENRNEFKLLHYLDKLYKLPIKVVHLEQTGVGRTVNGLRKLGGDVGDSAKSLVAKWKEMVVGEQEDEDDDDDDDDDDDEDDEDGYQTGEDHTSDSDEKEKRDRKRDSSASHRKSEEKRSKNGTSSRPESGHTSKNKDRHHKHNGHAKHKHRRSDSESSEDERPRKKAKKTEDDKKRSESDSEVKKQRYREPEEQKASKSKSGSKHKPKKEESRRSEHVKKDKEKKSRHKEKDRIEEKKSSKTASTSSSSKAIPNFSNNGIDSGSGASFAEALGMCEPSSSSSSSGKSSSKKKSLPAAEKKEKTSSSSSARVVIDDPVPKLLKEPNLPNLEPIDVNLSSLLPPITPNYRPLGNLISSDSLPKKAMSEAEALTSLTTSKNQRTKVYSGNKVGYGKVASLFELCTRVLQDNIDALEYTGGVPYTVLKPILEKANPNQLYMMEHHNPYLIEDTDELWALHCQKEFRNKKREELETWREMYLRCLDERDAKLKALTANIKQAQDKSIPVRMTKLAYVDAVAKPPRNIARKQAKNGTAFDVRKQPAMTPTARLNSLATAGEAGKVAVPNPGSRAAERAASSHANKPPKKAPLMLKSISSFKNRFKR